MKILLSCLLVAYLGTFALARQSKKEKVEGVREVLQVINKLSQFASEATIDESRINPKTVGEYETYTNSVRQKVENEIERIREPAEIVATARVCRAILGSQDADDVSYDRIFNVAYWRCVALLAADTGDEAAHALKVLEGASYLIGGEKLMFQEMKDAQLEKRRVQFRKSTRR